jgi:unsaturated chondroitin disaccharide hydrolase
VYRFTKDKQFLKQAENVANYIMTHPSIPTDKVPLWDFSVPKDSPRDASAAALIASALIELSDFVPAKRKQYLNFAKQQLISLSSDSYFAKEGTNGNFVLLHSVGNYPKNSEIDAPLTYADYYYVEALMRYKSHINNYIK